MKKRFSRKQRKILYYSRALAVALFCLCMAIGTINGLLLPLRPNTSAIEKRDLTPFPTFSLTSFMDGSWFSQISTWYADSYPGREKLVAMNNDLQKLKGIPQNEMVIGGNVTADEIGGKEKASSSAASSEQGQSADSQFEKRTEAPETNQLAADIEDSIMEGLLIKDGGAYGGFYFVQEACDTYTSALNRAAEELKGITNVYSILAPVNASIMLDDETYKKLSGSDAKQGIEYFYSRYNDLVKPVGTYDILKEHSSEPLYFRTDHHWTQLGAYYAYLNFCKVKGIEPVNKDELERLEYYPFTGSYTGMVPTATFTPDTFEAWVPKGGNTMKVFTGDFGNPNSDQYYNAQVVNTSEAIDQYNHYMRFIAGDQPFIEIDNNEINDGSSALVISESYGCAFVPWIVNNYDKVYAMDERYAEGNFVTFCKENNITDLIVVNNIQLANTTTLAAAMDEKLH